MKRNKQKASKILASLSSVNPPVTAEGDLDVTAFNRLPVVVEAKKQLMACGFNSSSALSSAGFIAAGLILKFKKGGKDGTNSN